MCNGRFAPWPTPLPRVAACARARAGSGVVGTFLIPLTPGEYRKGNYDESEGARARRFIFISKCRMMAGATRFGIKTSERSLI